MKKRAGIHRSLALLSDEALAAAYAAAVQLDCEPEFIGLLRCAIVQRSKAQGAEGNSASKPQGVEGDPTTQTHDAKTPLDRS